MTNGDFYKTEIDRAVAFTSFCRERQCDKDVCPVRRIKGNIIDGKLASDPMANDDGLRKLLRLDVIPACRRIWDILPYIEPDPVDNGCVHRVRSLVDYNLYLCNNPAIGMTGKMCDGEDMRKCFVSGMIRFPSAPATESDPNGLKPSDPGAKLDSGKNMLGLVLGGFAPAIAAVGKVGTYGANKYSPDGWKSVNGAKGRYMDALMRHLFAHLGGEKVDKESGLTHLSHAAWNVLALLTFEVKGGGE